jgi:hypothetical protein
MSDVFWHLVCPVVVVVNVPILVMTNYYKFYISSIAGQFSYNRVIKLKSYICTNFL